MLRHYYCLVQQHIEPETEELNDQIFLTLGGGEFTHANEMIQAIAELQGIDLPTATLHRKVISKEGASSFDNAQVRQLASQMSYSDSTARRYYQMKLYCIH